MLGETGCTRMGGCACVTRAGCVYVQGTRIQRFLVRNICFHCCWTEPVSLLTPAFKNTRSHGTDEAGIALLVKTNMGTYFCAYPSMLEDLHIFPREAYVQCMPHQRGTFSSQSSHCNLYSVLTTETCGFKSWVNNRTLKFSRISNL